MDHIQPLEVDDDLMEDFTQYYIDVHGCPPGAAKICAYLLFDFRRHGLGFETLLQALKISKSTLSEGLKLLEERQLILSFAPEGCRKRLFVINPGFVIRRFDRIEKALTSERDLLRRMLHYQKLSGYHNHPVEQRFNTLIDIFDTNARVLRQGIEKLIAIS